MRRMLILMTVMLAVTLAPALAEFGCVCDKTPCECFIQFGDEGRPVEAIARLLYEGGYLPDGNLTTGFSYQMESAVMAFQRDHDLRETGVMDDATLTWLIWGMSPDELDRENPFSIGEPVWVPTDGGIRHHRKSGCCKMQDPRLVSHRNALALNMQMCGRCSPTGLDTILP